MSDIKVRVGQQNAIKVLSSLSGASLNTLNAVNVVGGIADVTQLNVSGISTFVGLSTFQSNVNINGTANVNQLNITGVSTFVGVSTFAGDVYIGGDLYIKDDLVFNEVSAISANISGILTVGQSIYYPIGEPYGIAYFDLNDKLVSTGTTSSAISETNYILSTNSSGVPSWSNVIDGGSY